MRRGLVARLSPSGAPASAYVWGILCIGGLAAALRLWGLTQTPPGFHFDESFEGLEAWRILSDPTYRPVFLRGNFGVPVGFAYLTAGMFWLFERFGGEAGPLAMRATAALAGVLTVPLLIGATRELARHGLAPAQAALPIALASGATLAGLRWHIHFSRMGIEPILGPLLWAGSIWLLLYAWRVSPIHRTRAWVSFALCGAAAATAMYSYQAVWILPFILAASVLVLTFARQTLSGAHAAHPAEPPAAPRAAPIAPRRRLVGILLAGLLSALLVVPLGLVFFHEPALMTTRPTQVIAGEGNDRTFAENSLATLGMFLPFGSGDADPRRNIPGAPALNWIWGLAFLTGAGIGLRHIRQPAWLILWLSWLGLLLPGAVTEYAPHYHRILAASAPTVVIVGVGLWHLSLAARRGLIIVFNRQMPNLVAPLVAGSLILVAAYSDARAYFADWATRADLYYAFDEGLWEVGRWTDQQTESGIFISPRGVEHTTLAFAWRDRHAEDMPIRYDGRHIFPALATPAEDSLYIVLEHEDFRSPLLLPEAFPEAEPVRQFFDRDGHVYATAYRRPARARLARVPTVAHPAVMADGIHLLGFDLLPPSPPVDGIAYVQLHWQTEAVPTQDWTVFLHIVQEAGEGQVVAGHDAQPGQGALPTTSWRAGWVILDEHQIQLPSDLTPGEYTLRVGIYPTGAPDQALPPADLGVVRVSDTQRTSLRLHERADE